MIDCVSIGLSIDYSWRQSHGFAARCADFAALPPEGLRPSDSNWINFGATPHIRNEQVSNLTRLTSTLHYYGSLLIASNGDAGRSPRSLVAVFRKVGDTSAHQAAEPRRRVSGRSATKSRPCGAFISSTMTVMMIANCGPVSSVLRLKCLRRATSLTWSRSFRSGICCLILHIGVSWCIW